jgi:ubiquinone/menaquinone biosynthesis C-methylase UbiE
MPPGNLLPPPTASVFERRNTDVECDLKYNIRFHQRRLAGCVFKCGRQSAPDLNTSMPSACFVNVPSMRVTQESPVAESIQMERWEQRIEALIRSKGGNVSASEFQRALNVYFHDVEATCYDDLHRAMWDSLPPVFDQMVAEVEPRAATTSRWTLADIGCGTGLATELVLRTTLSARIAELQLVDTSSEMIARCQARSKSWGLPTRFIHGQIDGLPDTSVDFLIANSVLHHIPHLPAFCQQVTRVLRPGGFFLHVHDARSAAFESPIVRQRVARLAAARRRSLPTALLARIPYVRRIARSLRRWLSPRHGSDYLEEVNQKLIAAGLIKRKMSGPEIWSITDLRVGDLPYSGTDGISVDELATAMPACECLSIRTYGYFGELPSQLPPELAAEEQQLFAQSDEDGVFFAGL